MKIPPQTFFNFCACHVPLLRALADQAGETSEADIRRIIRLTCSPDTELPETSWRRINELQILLPSEPNRDFYYMADPVRRLLSYLFDDAKAATPEIIEGYIRSLEVLNKQLSRAIDEEDPAGVPLALEELQQTLRRIQNDLDETHRCILAEVSRYKIEKHGVSVREKFRRIAYWMDRYVDPIVNMVRPDGPLQATFDETERLLDRARTLALYNDLPKLDRNSRYLRVIERYALRIFRQCRRELQPLYESLRRASFIAQGAAIALDRFQREGADTCAAEHIVPVFLLRWQNVPSDAALHRTIANVTGYRPETAPVLSWDQEEAIPASFARRRWLEEVPAHIEEELPIADLIDWLLNRYPGLDMDRALAGFTSLVFATDFKARFTDQPLKLYETADGTVEAAPVELSRYE